MPPTRRYICSFCAKSFSRSEHKSRHERSHTNEKPFSCSICFAKFVRRDLLQRHLRTVHNEQNPSSLIQTAPSVNPSVNNTPEPQTANNNNNNNSSNTPEPFDTSLRSEDTNYNSNNTTLNAKNDDSIVSSNIISSNFYSLSERNLILLLALSKKFANLDLIDGKLVLINTDLVSKHIISNSKISNYLLIWGTVSNIKFPVILNLNKVLTLSTIESKIKKNGENNLTVFKSALFHAILAFGAAEFGQFSDCLKLFNTCWNLILPKQGEPEEIIEPLTILAYISFNYLQELYYFRDYNGEISKKIDALNTVSIHTVFQCLNEIIYNLFSDSYTSLKQTKTFHGSISLSAINYYKSHGLAIPPELLSEEVDPNLLSSTGRELFNYWYAYNLLSSYSLNFGKSPPKIRSIFLKKILPTNNDYHSMTPNETQVKSMNINNNNISNNIDFLIDETLKDALINLSKSPSLLRNLVTGNSNNINTLTNAIFPSNTFKNLTLRENCIIMGLSNELQASRLKEKSFFSNDRNVLHNSIIMANKSLNVNSNYQQFSNNTKNPINNESVSNNNNEYSLFLDSPYKANNPSSSITYSRNVSTFGSKSHGVHSPNEPNLNIINNTTINSNSNYFFNVNNFSNMLINNNINQDLINIYNLIIILKKKVLINCDNKLIQDLLIDYIIIPNHEIYWSLLYITIKEFTFINSDFTQWNELDDETMKHKFQQSLNQHNQSSTNSLHGSASFSNGAYGIGAYLNDNIFNSTFNGFADLIHDIMRDVKIDDVVSKITKFLIGNNGKRLTGNIIINNNLGLTSLPLLFIGYLISSLSPQNLMNEGFRSFNNDSPEDLMMNFLNLNAGSISNNNLIFLKYFLKLPKNFVNLLIENFFILIKIFYSFKRPLNNNKKQKINENHYKNTTNIDKDIENIIISPILQSIIYLIREMGTNLKKDDFLNSHNIEPVDIINSTFANDDKKNNNFVVDHLIRANNDIVLYFYLKNIEIIFITWLNFLNFGNNQFIQNNNNVHDNYLTRLIKYIELTMMNLYKTLDMGTSKKTVLPSFSSKPIYLSPLNYKFQPSPFGNPLLQPPIFQNSFKSWDENKSLPPLNKKNNISHLMNNEDK